MAGLELRGGGVALLDEPAGLEVRGAAPGEALRWHARLRDDDGRVWRAEADSAAGLDDAWAPAKPTTGAVAALLSLRPVDLDLRVEAPDGRAAARTLARRLLGDGVRVRRWRDGLAATLHLPAGEATATVLAGAAPEAPLAAALLASRGVAVLVLGPPPRGVAGDDARAAARERLAAVPAAAGEPLALDLPLPPGVPARDPDPGRAAAWDALLDRLGARPRGRD